MDWSSKKQSRRLGVAARRTAAMTAILASSSCTSVQWMDGQGRVRSFGWASIQRSASDPLVERIVAPGVSLRLLPGLQGYGIGWRETVLLRRTDKDHPSRFAAFADRHYGIALDAWSLSVGVQRRFVVLGPSSTDACRLVQSIRYVEGELSATSIQQTEVP